MVDAMKGKLIKEDKHVYREAFVQQKPARVQIIISLQNIMGRSIQTS